MMVIQFRFRVLKYNELSKYLSEYALFWDRIHMCIRPIISIGLVPFYSGLFISLNLLGYWPSYWCSCTVSVCGGAWSLSSESWLDDVSFNASVTIKNPVLEGRSRSVNTISNFSSTSTAKYITSVTWLYVGKCWYYLMFLFISQNHHSNALNMR